jgi:hypothetical protein
MMLQLPDSCFPGTQLVSGFFFAFAAAAAAAVAVTMNCNLQSFLFSGISLFFS